MVELAILYPASGTFSAALIRTSMTRLNRMGLSGHPCFTPCLIVMGSVAFLLVYIEVVVPSYRSLNTSRVLPSRPASSITRNRTSCGTESYASFTSSHMRYAGLFLLLESWSTDVNSAHGSPPWEGTPFVKHLWFPRPLPRWLPSLQ